MTKNYKKDISSITTPIKFHLPDGSTIPFENSAKAQQWFNKNYGNGYSMVEYTPTQGDSQHPVQLQEITVTAQAPKSKSTPSAKTGVDMYIGRNYDPEFNKHYYGMSHLDALLGKVRVENMKKADPQVIKNFRDGSNAAAAFFAAPLAAYGAGEYVLPWVAQNVAPYLSARGWLAATQAAGNTPAWLTPTSATAIDAALAGGTTGVSVSDMIQNGPTVGNVLGTTAGVVGLGAEAAPTIMEGVQAGQKAYNTFKLSKELNKAVKQFDGTVGASYFKSPSNWYRITESPEIMDIRFRGKNVTTRDLVSYDSPSDNFRNFVIENQLKPGSGENEGYWVMPQKKDLLNVTKYGSAHGNTSQAAKGKIWDIGNSASGKFPRYIIEGEGPTKVFRGFNPVTGEDSRSYFVKVPWEEVPLGARIGFHTGEMPIEGLRAFRRLSNGRYQYEGPILPDKTIRVQTSPSRSIYDDYNFEQYGKNLSVTPTKTITKGSRSAIFDFDWDNEFYDPDNFTSIEGLLAKKSHIQEGKNIISDYGEPELNTVSFQGGQEYPIVMTTLDQNSPMVRPAVEYFNTQVKPRFRNFGLNVKNPFEISSLLYGYDMPYYTVKNGTATMHLPPSIGGGAADNVALVFTRAQNPKSTWVHEGASHLTDNHIPKTISDQYQSIATIPEILKQKGFKWNTPDSGMWEEARAALNQVRAQMLKDGLDLNNLSDDVILDYLQSINSSYGSDYSRIANNLSGKDKSEYVDKIRKALIHLPVVGGFIIGNKEQFKLGGTLNPVEKFKKQRKRYIK